MLEGLVADGFQGDEKAREYWRYVVRTTALNEGTLLEHHHDATHNPMAYRLDDTPDLFQPLAATLAGTGRVKVMGMLHSLASKESDRLAAMEECLSMLGLAVDVIDGQFGASGMIIQHPPPLPTHGDHRMAMTLAPLALVCDRITILDPDVVDKSYPDYWKDLEKAGFGVERS